METLKPIHLIRGRAVLLASACLIAPLLAGEPRGGSSLAESELSRRSVAIDEAQELLRKGDEAYTAGNYAQAVEAYAGARDLIPDAPISAELRAAATERYAQASVEQARNLSRNGDVAGAKAVVDKVLVKSVAPNNPGALAMRGQLDDPIRTNPALTAEHAKDVDSVRRLLYTAEGAYNLGKYDQAKSTYEEVLRIDPTNSAARRGLEQVAVAKSDYQKSAYDHSRAEMLGQVDSQWELQVPPQATEPSLTDSANGNYQASGVSVKNKLDRIIISKIALDQASLDEALDFLRLRSAESDTIELDPSRKGVNFTVNLGPPDSPAVTKIRSIRFDLQLANVPLSQVLRYITDITHTTFTTDDFSVIISAAGSDSAALVSRTYRVPPDFISSISNGGTEPAAAAADPFGEAPASGGLLAQRLGAKEALIKQGVIFPEGASASYTPATNSLRVVNTSNNLDYIGQIIDALAKTEPVMVALTVTMIKVQQTDLKELGFDWLLTNIGFGGDAWIPGASKLNFDGGTVGNGRNLDDVVLPVGSYTRNPITSGNRSGDSAISGSSIDDVINNPSGRQRNNSAPGIVGGYGNIDNASLQMLMRGLDQKKGTDVMAQPSTVTRSGQSASVTMVREMIYPTEYEPPELPNNTGGGVDDIFGFGGGGGNNPVTPATPTAFTKRDIGITLEVLPVADANKRFVNVTLNPSFVQFDGFVNYGSPINTTQQSLIGSETIALTENQILMPIFSKQSFSTSVDVADGANLVIGGLTQESVQNVEDQTPILGSVPIIGRLFQEKARQPVTTAVIFLINVELMDPTGRRYRDR
ncbi:MAG: Amuc_1098 family type IV pilus outer membrane protein [Verrucomicrobiota bacterium]